jgi:hypothetical protein
MDCFAEPVIGPHSRDPLARNDGESGNAYLPGLSSKTFQSGSNADAYLAQHAQGLQRDRIGGAADAQAALGTRMDSSDMRDKDEPKASNVATLIRLRLMGRSSNR